ncbi:trypsin-like peptidase domain-containing protein [Verrucomicrobium sp. BvORR106]|uniref:trypsin-like peptidase domain-containing protein n=1 Tax=Verrucomicrobium sp. BvORR106 TaxID=1403819 RepID=UPI00069108A2|nr:trypsin-like peptidase domain-containing protein [Verrucomicrobium sp. BvORR106]
MPLPKKLPLFFLGTVATVSAWADATPTVSLDSLIGKDPAPLENSGAVTLSYAATVRKCLPSVVTVLAVKYEDPGGQIEPSSGSLDLGTGKKEPRMLEAKRGSGSGVILTKEGHIITNNHVVEDADTLHVRLAESQQDLEATLIGRDPLTDIALLKIAAFDLHPMSVSDSSTLQRGDVVLALGSPFGLEQTVTLGIVSATSRTMNFIKGGYEDFIQTDAPINPGNSGGALVDGLGRLVGINTAAYPGGGWRPANSIGFAVPANLALRVANDLQTRGHVVRGFVGLRWVDTEPQETAAFSLRNEHRLAKVIEIVASSPADTAGFAYGDIITGFNGANLPTTARLRFAVAALPPGSKATFDVLREGKKLSLECTLVESPTPAKSAPSAPASETRLTLRAGLEGVDIDHITRATQQIPVDIKGVLITKADEDGRPFAKVTPGDVITTLNGTNISDCRTLDEALKKLPPETPLMLKLWKKSGAGFAMIKRK